MKEDDASQIASLCLRNFDTGEDLMIGERPAVAMVDMGLLAVITDNGNGRLSKRLDAIEKRLAALETEANVNRAEPEPPAETRCEVCSRAVNIGDDVLYCSEDDTVQHTGCSGLTNARGTPWMG